MESIKFMLLLIFAALLLKNPSSDTVERRLGDIEKQLRFIYEELKELNKKNKVEK